MGRPFDSIGPKLTSLINWASGLPDSIASQPISAQPFLEGPRSLAPVLGEIYLWRERLGGDTSHRRCSSSTSRHGATGGGGAAVAS